MCLLILPTCGSDWAFLWQAFKGFFLKGKWAQINVIMYDFYQILQHMCHLGPIVHLYSNNNHVTAFCDLPLMILRERWHKSRTQSDVVWFIIFHRTVFNTSLKPCRLPWPFPCSWGWKRSTWCQWLGKEKSIYNSNGKFHSCKVKLWLCAVITRSALYTAVNVTRTLSSSISPLLNGGILHMKQIIEKHIWMLWLMWITAIHLHYRAALVELRALAAGVSFEGYCSSGACYAKIWYSHGNMRSNLAPFFSPTGL